MSAGAGLSAHGRYAWLDLARGIALIAMAIYHFVWDLSLFGLVSPQTPFEPHWRYLARATAGSFLFLAGISLTIAHANGIRWRPYSRRLAMILGAAGLITALTLYATPEQFIFFGILHMIAAGSVAGLALVRLPWWIAIGIAIVVLWIGLFYENAMFDHPFLWWTGLGTASIPSSDLVPFFPSFAAIAAGIAVAKLANLEGGSTSSVDTSTVSRALRWAGRHSLFVYLVHQPILIGLIFAFVRIARI